MRYFYEIAASPFAADDEKEFGGKAIWKRAASTQRRCCHWSTSSNIFSNLAEKVGNVIMRGKNESGRRRGADETPTHVDAAKVSLCCPTGREAWGR